MSRGHAPALQDAASEFAERGFAGPVPIFDRAACRAILERLQGERSRTPMDWSKGWAATSPQYYALGAHDRILALVAELIGSDVILWGASLAIRRPGKAHPWHTDIETSAPASRTVSVWIGLANASARSSLKIVSHSHRFGVTIQEVMQQENASREGVTDADVARWARQRNERSEVVEVKASDGEAVLFDGRLWHGSHNSTLASTRTAVLLQYATPQTPIRIPNLARLSWPFEPLETPRPPCVLVRGNDAGGANRIVPPPAVETRADAPPSLSRHAHALPLPLERDTERGWKPHPLFAGATPNVRRMACHVSVLEPGCQPHPPHRHEDEEILIILDGDADLIARHESDTGELSRRRVGRGAFVFYPADSEHTIHNPSERPVTYLMFKWRDDRKRAAQRLAHTVIDAGDPGVAMQTSTSSGISMRRVLHGETECLRRLHAHVTTVEGGRGYDPHVDAHDVAIVVLEGTIEALDARLGAGGVGYCAAGVPHGMKNVGAGRAVYAVFEFHGRHAGAVAASERRFSRRLWRALRDPKRFVKAVRGR